jgi:AcrR family transcriptional regulator
MPIAHDRSARRRRPMPAAPPPRRRQILEAALDCFSQRGFAATTMDHIRARSAASTGSLYHHFAGKEELAAELYVAALRDYQAGFLRALTPRVGARRAVRIMVEYHLCWVREHPDWARYLLDMGRQAELVAATRSAVDAMNRHFNSALLAWLAPHLQSGALRRLPPSLFYAVVLGPAQYVARQWVSDPSSGDLMDAGATLADAAWCALRLGGALRGGRS